MSRIVHRVSLYALRHTPAAHVSKPTDPSAPCIRAVSRAQCGSVRPVGTDLANAAADRIRNRPTNSPKPASTMKIKSLLTSALALAFAISAHAEPLKIGYSDWPGWTAWEIAKEKGFFKKHGVDVKLVWFPIYTDSLTALHTGKLDANCQTWSGTIPPLAEGFKLKVVLANDHSAGNDGFVAKKEFKTIKSLKGKTVATELGTVDHFLLLQALAKNGMTEKDIVFKNMTVPDAAAAFRQGKLDAAVLWQPSLNDVMKEGKANLLFTSKDVPGLIPDPLVFQTKVATKRAADIQKVVAACFDVIEFIDKNGNEAAKVVEQKPEDYKAFLPGTKFFDLKANLKTFKKDDADVHSLSGSGKIISDIGRADSLLAVMGLASFYKSYPRKLSGGMTQRGAIARALTAKPKVLLMDKPFGALDAQTREEMQELLLRLSRHEKITTLFGTHDVEEAIYLSTRILVSPDRPGRIIREIKVPFGAERPPDIKLTREFFDLKRELLSLLAHDRAPTPERDELLRKLVARPS